MHALTTTQQPSSHRRSSWIPWWSVAPAVAAVAAAVATPLALGAALAPAVVAAGVDARSGRLPDALVASVAVAGIAIALVDALSGRPAALGAVAAGAAWFAAPVLVAHVAAPAAMGFGDVKLAAALGIVIGLVEPRAALLALCLAAAGTAAVGLVARRTTLAFGPGLVAGAVLVLAGASAGGAEVLGWR